MKLDIGYRLPLHFPLPDRAVFYIRTDQGMLVGKAALADSIRVELQLLEKNRVGSYKTQQMVSNFKISD